MMIRRHVKEESVVTHSPSETVKTTKSDAPNKPDKKTANK